MFMFPQVCEENHMKYKMTVENTNVTEHIVLKIRIFLSMLQDRWLLLFFTL